MNDSDVEVEVDLDAIYAKRKRDLIDYEDIPLPREDTINQTMENEEVTPAIKIQAYDPIQDIINKMSKNYNGGIMTSYRLHHFWKGNNAFCLEGRFLNGLKKRSFKNKLTLFLINISFCLYLIFPAFYLYDKISPFITLLTIYTFILTVFFFFMTSRYFSFP